MISPMDRARFRCSGIACWTAVPKSRGGSAILPPPHANGKISPSSGRGLLSTCLAPTRKRLVFRASLFRVLDRSRSVEFGFGRCSWSAGAGEDFQQVGHAPAYRHRQGFSLERRVSAGATGARQVLEVRKDGSANPFKQYVWSLRYIDAPVCRYRDADTDGSVDDTLYYFTDANFNVTALVDASDGDVVERYAYDPYGKAAVLNGADDAEGGGVNDFSADADNASDWDNAILYCGYLLDGETGLYRVRHRYYHPTLGRWVQWDLGGYVDGMSLYEYVGSSPLCYLDPYGLWRFWDWVLPGDGNATEDAETTARQQAKIARKLAQRARASGEHRAPSQLIALAIDREQDARGRITQNIARAARKGAAEGHAGAWNVVGSTLTFGGTDALRVTESESYQGGAYRITRISATVSREALIMAATAGLGNMANAGRFGYRGAQIYRHARNVMGLSGSAYGMYHGVDTVVAGVKKVRYCDNSWGYVDITFGALQAALSARSGFKIVQSYLPPITVERVISTDEWVDTRRGPENRSIFSPHAGEMLLRGGPRETPHYVTPHANSSAVRATQRLALAPGKMPDLHVRMQVPRGIFSEPATVPPATGMPGGGLEMSAPGSRKIPIRIVRIRRLSR